LQTSDANYGEFHHPPGQNFFAKPPPPGASWKTLEKKGLSISALNTF